ncbi:MAG: hypothetical protein MK085_07550 [Phycisphaerales bacterium]|nr:hypothetical protein [Phycisphaerales bacterium]
MPTTSSPTRQALVLIMATATALLMGLGSQDAGTTPQPERSGSPYLLTICPVSERPLPEDGGTVAIIADTGDRTMDGREIRVCCPGCLNRFNKDPRPFIAKMDERMIKEQTPRYPPGACLVMDTKELPDPRGPEADDCTQLIWKNRLVRLCCKRCERTFMNDPDQFIAKLDARAIAYHGPRYKLDTCVATGQPLGDNPHVFMLGDHVVKTCCAGCRPRVENDWATKIAATNAHIRSTSDAKEAQDTPSGPILLLPDKARTAIIGKYPTGQVYGVSRDNETWKVELRTDQGNNRMLLVSEDGWILSDKPAK